MKLKKLPEQKILHDALQYNKNTGIFVWKWRDEQLLQWNRKFAGRVAGTKGPKGIVIIVNNVSYFAHRLAWVYVYGDVLKDGVLIDHKNCDCYDNSIDNLRPSSHGQNGSNSRGWSKKYLPKGVSLQKNGRFRSRIGDGKKVIYLGTFDTAQEAHDVYMKAARKFKGEFARAS